MAATTTVRPHTGPGTPGPKLTREERLDAAHQLLANGVAELTTSDAWKRMLSVAARFHHYSPTNILLVLAQRPQATGRIAGLKTWNALGRKVNAGERGIRILAPIIRERTDEITGDDENAACGFTVVSVFSEDQTAGEPLDVLPTLLSGSTPEGLIETICAHITAAGFTVSFGDCGGANGLTNWLTRTVTIRADMEPLQTAKTALHEWAHCAAHDPSDPANSTLEPTCRGLKEVEAESIAFVVANLLGLDTSEYSYPYIANWALAVNGEIDPIRATAERVIRIAQTMANALDT